MSDHAKTKIEPLEFWEASGPVRPLDEIKANYLLYALAQYGGDASKAARALKISRSTLYRIFGTIGVAPSSTRPAVQHLATPPRPQPIDREQDEPA